MFKALGICIFIVVVWNPLSALQHETIKDDPNGNIPAYFGRARTRRAFGSVAALWFRATQKLLYGTRKVPPSGDVVQHTYEKKGDYLRALKDFESVNPANVIGYQRAREIGKIGMIGNKKIILRIKLERVEGKYTLPSPTIELQKYTGNMDKWDTIKYINRPR